MLNDKCQSGPKLKINWSAIGCCPSVGRLNPGLTVVQKKIARKDETGISIV